MIQFYYSLFFAFMPIFNGGGSGQSSPSLIEYNFSEGKEIILSESPQKIIEAAPPQTQRSFWVYFDKPTFLAGKENMVGAIALPAKSCFEFSDLGGEFSDWWAVSPGGTAFVQIKKRTSSKILLDSTEFFKYASSEVFGLDDKVFLEYSGQKTLESISITNQVINYANSETPIDYDYVQCMIKESQGNPEYSNFNYDNLVNIRGGETILYTWNVQEFPYLSILFGYGEWMAYAVLNFSGNNVFFSEYLEY